MWAIGNAAPEATPSIGQQIADYVETMVSSPQAFRGQQLRGTGHVREFEQLLANRCGFPFCLATCNATTALLVVALAAKLRDREIICPPNSWGAIFGVLEFAGARLIRAEEDAHGNIAPASIRNLLTPVTTAIVTADWNGVRHEARAVRALCDSGDLLYIEDTSFIPLPDDGPEACSLADIQVISFGPGKSVSLGEGGALLTRSEAIYTSAVALSQHPERCGAEGITELPRYQFLNGRMHPVAALLGLSLLSGRSAR